MMGNILANVSTVLLVVGVLAFLVSVITQVLKGVFAKLPTDILVVILSLVLSVGLYLAYISYIGHVFAIYELAGVFVGAFIVAYVAMYGWQKLTDLYNRFKVPTDLSNATATLQGLPVTSEPVAAKDAVAEPIKEETTPADASSTGTTEPSK
jgi:hypothetical protein